MRIRLDNYRLYTILLIEGLNRRDNTMLKHQRHLRRATVLRIVIIALTATVLLTTFQTALSASHRDAPLIHLDDSPVINDIGVGPYERVELLLVNHCEKTVDVEVDTTIILGDPPSGGIPVKTLRLDPNSFVIEPLTLPDAPATINGRRYVSLGIRAHPDRCMARDHHYLQAEIAIVAVDENGMDSKVIRNAGLRSDGDLVQATRDAASNKLFVGGLSWDTSDDPVAQGARLIMMNHCDIPLDYRIEARSLGTEEQPDVPDGVLKAGEGAVIPLDGDREMKWFNIHSVNFRPTEPRADDDNEDASGLCRRSGVSVSAEVFNREDGSTAHTKGFGFVTFSDGDDLD